MHGIRQLASLTPMVENFCQISFFLSLSAFVWLQQLVDNDVNVGFNHYLSLRRGFNVRFGQRNATNIKKKIYIYIYMDMVN